MTFKNEVIPEQDKEQYIAVINYHNLQKQAPYIPKFNPSLHIIWTIDRERDVYLVMPTGGGPNQLDYYTLVFGGRETVIFNAKKIFKVDSQQGRDVHLNIYDLRIPEVLEPRQEEIKQLIREGLEEKQYLNFTADGGTYSNPNITARLNITAFSVEFK